MVATILLLVVVTEVSPTAITDPGSVASCSTSEHAGVRVSPGHGDSSHSSSGSDNSECGTVVVLGNMMSPLDPLDISPLYEILL